MINRIKEIVENNPNKKAYVVNNESITYNNLWNDANKYSDLLKRQGTSPIIIYGHKEINMIISILSCILANRTYIPIGPCTPIYRIKQIINQTGSELILTDRELDIDIDICKLEELDKYQSNDIKENSNEIVYIIFTSGSTGDPKGVPISKENLNNFITWENNIYPLSEYKDINVLNQASFSFDLSVADLFYSLCNGHTLIALDNDIKEDYEGTFEILKKVNVTFTTPSFMKMCLINNDFNYNNYPNLKCTYFCGEKLETKTVRKLFEAFPNINIINAYGPTEATSAVSSILITKDMLTNDLLPVGEVNKFATDILIENDEIILKGKSVFSGYLGNYLGGFYKDNNINCYKTGDIGYIKDNKLYCKGRKDNQIKYLGYRIELDDIENNINKIKDVKECAVIAKYNEQKTVKSIKAFVVTNKDKDYIKDELNKLLPHYMIPKSIIIKDKLPINQNGKIDRKKLEEYE